MMRRALLIPALGAIFAMQMGTVSAQEPEADLGISIGAFSGSSGVVVDASYFNRGPSEAPDTRIVFDVPDGSRLVESTAECSQAADRTVTCQLGTMFASTAGLLRLRFMPAEPGLFTVTAVISSTAADPNPADNRDEASVTVEDQADLSVDLSGPGTVSQGDVFNLFVGYQNAGPLPASDVTILVDLPEGLEYAGGACTGTPSGDIECRYAELHAMTAGVEIVQVRAVTAGTHTIGATISSATPDPDPSDNSDSLDVTVEPAPGADLATVVTDQPDPVKPGKAVTYTIEITNAGPSSATDVTADVGWTTTAGGRTELIGVSATGATCVVTGQQRVECHAASLAAGDSIVIQLQLRPRGPGELSVMASASATEPDPDPSNNTETETTRIAVR